MADPERGESRARPDIRGGLPAGTTLRGYELRFILGKGAFGITYRARDLTLDRDVAIKEYLPTALALREGRTTVLPISTDHAEQFAWGRERFMEEARTLARLDRTPAIVRVFDFLEDNGTAYMVMALIEGETLNKKLLRERKLTPEAVERLLFPLLDGLEEVHGIGFLHRDIKPANIMVDTHGRPTLIDFGASRAAMAGRSTTMTAIFTPGYAASEQFTSAKLGPWTDIYGLAATFYHAITGNIPPSAIDRILKDSYEPLAVLQPEGFPPGLLAGIDAGLAIRVDDRPKTIAEWRQMLRSDGYGAASSEATRVARRSTRLARAAGRTRNARLTLKGPALWGAAAAAILVIAGGGWLAMNPLSPGISMASLSAEQLEQALAERRKADTLAAEKRRLEEEAREKAAAEAEAKRQADAELDQARQARLKAEQELAELKARLETRRQADAGRDQEALAAQRAIEEAAQRKAEQDAAALREAEEEAEKKAAAEAETKRQADQALAEAAAQRKRAEAEAKTRADAETAARAQASAEAQRKAEQEAAARRQADEAAAKAQAEREKAEAEARIKAEAKAEADKAAAVLAKQKEEGEAAERALRLEQADRQRLQVALTSLGFDTRGNDGMFGPRTREMIASWQKARKEPPTGFLTAAQQQAMTNDAAAALAKYDEQKKAEEEAKSRLVTAASTAGSTTIAAAKEPVLADGTYTGALQISGVVLRFSVQLTNGVGTGAVTRAGCNSWPISFRVDPAGNVTGEAKMNTANSPTSGCNPVSFAVSGRVVGHRLVLGVVGMGGGGAMRREFVLAQGGAEATDTALSTGSAQSDIAAASPPATRQAPVRASASLVPGANDHPGCGDGRFAKLEVTIYSNRIEVRMPWGLETLPVGADGAFSGSVRGPTMLSGSTRFSVRGNVKSKEMQLELMGGAGNPVCTYTGTIA
jgi:serine/threonine protein kinase/peptidoglycan hydrolase-like protein with peptidoglycan-binding domain